MKELLDKVSEYNLFNYLLPGTLFAIIADKLTEYHFVQQDIIVGAFLYYFIGLIISRFGSLVVEPMLKRSGFLIFVEYKRFVAASKKDLKIDLLSQENNMYRTFCAMIVLLLLLKFYELIEGLLPVLRDWNSYILIILLIIIFLFSYRKQTQYITKRVKANE